MIKSSQKALLGNFWHTFGNSITFKHWWNYDITKIMSKKLYKNELVIVSTIISLTEVVLYLF